MSAVRPRTLQQLLAATSPYAREDRRRSWIAVLSTAALTVGALAVASSPVTLLLRIPATLLSALLLVRCFVIYHDFEHGAILRDSAAAKPLMRLFGLLILSPSSIWNRLHNYHHSHNCQFATSGVGSYPVLTVREYHQAPRWTRMRYRIIRSPLLMVFAYLGVFLGSFCIKSIHDEPRRHKDSALALLLHAVVLAVFAWLGWRALLFGVVLPLTCAHAFGTYLFYAQHNFPEVRLQPREEWDYVHAAIYSSSFMDGNFLMHWFTANIGYHHLHHLNPRIPFYRLPEALAAVPELNATAKTSLHPREIVKCLRLKLWDSQSCRMVAF